MSVTAEAAGEQTLHASIEACARLTAEGHPAQALTMLATLQAANAADPQLYQEATRALIATVIQGARPFSDTPTQELVRALIEQRHCPAPPSIFHREAVRVAQADPALAAQLVGVIEPCLRAAISEGPSRAAVLLLLVLRKYLPVWIDQHRLTEWHVAAFPSFSEVELSLPYSVAFNSELFGRNQDDLVETYVLNGEAARSHLGPWHLLLLEWLSGVQCFRAGGLAGLLNAPIAPDALPAVRSLAARHWQAEDGPSEKLLVTVMGEDVASLVADLSADRAALLASCGQPSRRLGALLLHNRPWQAAMAARRVIQNQFPLPARKRPLPRVAVCVSGQLRGWLPALQTWKHRFFSGADVSVFVHTWRSVGRSPAHPSRQVLPFAGAAFCSAWRRIGLQEGYEALQASYPRLFMELANADVVNEDLLADTYNANRVVVEDERAPPYAEYDNQQKMHFKIFAAHHLASAYAEESGEPWDVIVRIRPDLPIKLPCFDWWDVVEYCRASPVILAQGRWGVHYGNPMMGDQFALGAPAVMARYANAWTIYPRLAANGLARCPPAFTGHLTLAQTCWLAGIEIARSPMRFGLLLEAAPLSVEAALAAIEQDAAGRMDAVDVILMDAVRADMH